MCLNGYLIKSDLVHASHFARYETEPFKVLGFQEPAQPVSYEPNWMFQVLILYTKKTNQYMNLDN